MHLLLNLDLFMVKRMLWREPIDVGCYVLASTLSKSFYGLMLSLPTALFPFLAQAISEGEVKLIPHHLKQIERMLLSFTIGASLLAVSLSPYLIKLFLSKRYLAASRPLWFLIPGMGAMSGFSLFSAVLQAISDLKTPLISALCLVGGIIGLNWIFIPRWGVMGAAWTVTLIGISGLLSMKGFVNRRIKTLRRERIESFRYHPRI